VVIITHYRDRIIKSTIYHSLSSSCCLGDRIQNAPPGPFLPALGPLHNSHTIFFNVAPQFDNLRNSFTMSSLDSVGGRAASAGLAGSALAPLVFFWVVSMRGAIAKGTWYQPIPLSHRFLRAAMPAAVLGISLASASYSIIAATAAGRIQVEVSRGAGVYLGLSASFFLQVAAIQTTLTMYLITLAVLYTAWQRLRWWSFLRFVAVIGGAILVILAVVFWSRSMRNADEDTDKLVPGALLPTKASMAPLLIIVDVVLVLLAASIVGAASYAVGKVKGRIDIFVGHVGQYYLLPL